MEILNHLSKKELIERLVNAKTTSMMCTGHRKTYYNGQLVGEYEQELLERYEYVISGEDLNEGKFNGVGSY